MRPDDEDDRSGGAGGSSWVDRIVIPDDLSELDAEIRALHRERRAQRRRARLRRLTGSGRTGGPLLLVTLLLIAGVAGLLVMFQPRRTAGSLAPLSTAPAADRRLPDTPVRLVDGSTRPIRGFHPAVFALAPIGCRCDAQLKAAGLAAHRHNLRLYLVDRTLPPLPAGLTDATAVQAGRADRHGGPEVQRGDGRQPGRRRSGAGVRRRRRPGGRGAAETDREHAGGRAVRGSSGGGAGQLTAAVSTVVAVGTVGALVRACHPEPTAAVTAVAAALAAAVGRGVAGTIAVAAAVLAGQLSVGWMNDYLDRDRDVRVHRADKPVVAGMLAPATLRTATAVAAVAVVPLSLLSGWLAGSLHLVAVASAWSYNLWLKATVLSVLPYAGLVRAAACLHHRPACPATRCTGLAGRGGRAARRRRALRQRAAGHQRRPWPPAYDGLPHRLGATGSRVAAVARCSRPPRWCSPPARPDRRARSGSPPSWSPSSRPSVPGCSGGRDRGRPSSAFWWWRRSTWRCWSPPAAPCADLCGIPADGALR